MIEADLHIHTTASDGADRPAEVVDKAKMLGLQALAITDHDTMDGVAEAAARGREIGIEVIPGVEINTDYNDTEIHILGYYPDEGDRPFRELLAKQREARRKRMTKMIGKLQALGLAVKPEEVAAAAGSGTVGRPHLARVMAEKGYVSSIKEAFIKYIGFGSPAYVARSKLTPHEAIAAIVKAGGLPVLAHPGIINNDSLIPGLISAGLVGIEAFHSDHDARTTAHYLELARQYNLVVTGGSDYHGLSVKSHVKLAGAGVAYSAVTSLKKAGNKYCSQEE